MLGNGKVSLNICVRLRALFEVYSLYPFILLVFQDVYIGVF